MIVRLSKWLERGIWAIRFSRYYITFSAPWARIIVDAYVMRRVRLYRLGGWLMVIHKT